MKTFLLSFLFILTLALPAQAQQAIDVGSLPYQALFEEVSLPNESKEAFLLRIAPRLVAYSEETGFEACGSLAQGQNGYGMVVGTNGSRLGCAIYHNKTPVGMVSLHTGLHSHGGPGEFTANKSDRIFLGEDDYSRMTRRIDIHGQDRDLFSEVDYQAGDLYLATPKGVLFHPARGRVVSVIASL